VPSRTGVIEMDVGQRDVPKIRRTYSIRPQLGHQPIYDRGRPRIDDGRLLRIDEIARDRAFETEVLQIDAGRLTQNPP
jgi:hypothetical protein